MSGFENDTTPVGATAVSDLFQDTPTPLPGDDTFVSCPAFSFEVDDQEEAQTRVNPFAARRRQPGHPADVASAEVPLPHRLRNAQLFDDLPEATVPPPLVVSPRPRVVLEKLGSNARLEVPRSPRWLLVLVCSLAGLAVALIALLVVLRLCSGREPEDKASADPEVLRQQPAAAIQPMPTGGPGESAAAIDLQRPPPKRRPPRRRAKPAPTDPPPVAAGKRLARALAHCRLNPRGQSLRLGVRFSRPGHIQRVYVAKRRWIGSHQRRCIRQRLTGRELREYRVRGYAEWLLWLDPVRARLVRHRR
jgi:hypothetical protein